MSEPEPETRREPEAVGRVVHEPKQMPKTTAPKPAAPKQEEFAPKGGATKPPEPQQSLPRQRFLRAPSFPEQDTLFRTNLCDLVWLFSFLQIMQSCLPS